MNITKITGLGECSRDRIRELIRIRDGHTCQICGKKWIKGTRRFDVHHKDCEKEKSRQCDNYEKEKDNMVTLCHKCHLGLPEHRATMKQVLRKELTPEQRESLMGMLRAGVSRKIIASKYNVRLQTVQRYVDKIKIIDRKKRLEEKYR